MTITPGMADGKDFEDPRFLLIDTKKIFEISKEDAKKLQIFIELGKENNERIKRTRTKNPLLKLFSKSFLFRIRRRLGSSYRNTMREIQ